MKKLLLLCILIAGYGNTTSFEGPKLKWPEKALSECIIGEVIVNMEVTDGFISKYEIISSKPKHLYTNAFRAWIAHYQNSSREPLFRWGPKGKDIEYKKFTFNYNPCFT